MAVSRIWLRKAVNGGVLRRIRGSKYTQIVAIIRRLVDPETRGARLDQKFRGPIISQLPKTLPPCIEQLSPLAWAE
jgi:hypothetical protein